MTVMPNIWTMPAETGAIRAVVLAASPAAVSPRVVDAPRADPTARIDGLSLVAAEPAGPVAGHDVPDEALMADAWSPGHPLPGGTVRYAAPFGI
jgi:hypothetical protein